MIKKKKDTTNIPFSQMTKEENDEAWKSIDKKLAKDLKEMGKE
jgi:hypothetical protein